LGDQATAFSSVAVSSVDSRRTIVLSIGTERWKMTPRLNTLLPSLIGPALFVGFYNLLRGQ
jgi:hypothetical protein